MHSPLSCILPFALGDSLYGPHQQTCPLASCWYPPLGSPNSRPEVVEEREVQGCIPLAPSWQGCLRLTVHPQPKSSECSLNFLLLISVTIPSPHFFSPGLGPPLLLLAPISCSVLCGSPKYHPSLCN